MLSAAGLNMRGLATAVMLGTALLSNSAGASTIYSNLSGGYQSNVGWMISGSTSMVGGPTTHSEGFISLKTAGVSQIDIALGWIDDEGANNSATVSLYAAGSATPLWTDNLFGLPTFGSGDLIAIGGISGVNVTVGYSYVLEVAPYSLTSDTLLAWNLTTSPGPGAFDVLGSVTTTPLPSTWTMLIAGFAGLGFLAYRGTKKNTATAAA